MPQEYRYPLTRVCLRQGALTLPRTMLDLFPEAGQVTALDTMSDEPFDLEVLGPRSVGGFAAFFASHELEVNDELLIRPLEDGRFAVTPLSRHRAADYGRQRAVQALLDELADANVPVTEAEIRALYPDVPEALDLRSALVADGRFVHHEGRWQLETTVLKRVRAEMAEAAALDEAMHAGDADADGDVPEAVGVVDAAPPTMSAGASATAGGGGADTLGGDHGAQAGDVSGHESHPEVQDGAEGMSGIGAEGGPGVSGGRGETDTPGDTAPHAGEQTALWSAGVAPARAFVPPPPGGSPSSAPPPPGGSPSSPPSPSEVVSEPSGTASDTADGSGSESARRPPARGSFFPGDAATNRRRPLEDDEPDLQMVGRAREALGAFGYRVESLGQGQLLAHAELGRKHHTVLVNALGYGQRLDWAALLARRRETGARYLAVFGDYRDLHRLQGPADLARATLWSWDGVERARGLSRTVPVSPHDLEPHFEQGGLYDQGLERFEKTMAGRVAERGEFSEVLTRLAGMRAPSVFLLEELAGDSGVSRDHVLKVLERLSEAPFHLVARIDQGEFCLRQAVGPALDNLVGYARSLQSRLPNRTRARVTGLSDPNEPLEGGLLPGQGAPSGAPTEQVAATETSRASGAPGTGSDVAMGPAPAEPTADAADDRARRDGDVDLLE